MPNGLFSYYHAGVAGVAQASDSRIEVVLDRGYYGADLVVTARRAASDLTQMILPPLIALYPLVAGSQSPTYPTVKSDRAHQ